MVIYANHKAAYQTMSDKCPAKQKSKKKTRKKISDKDKETINDILMIQLDISKENARLQLEIEEKSPSLQLKIDKKALG